MGFEIFSRGLKKTIRKVCIFTLSVFFAGMAVQSSGIAAFNNLEYNIVVTPDNTLIIWPKNDADGNPVTYDQPALLTSEELLEAEVCLTSSNCTVYAIQLGAVYYRIVDIPGVGEVVFYYDEFGRLVGSQKRSEIAADPDSQITTANENLILEPIHEPVDLEDYFGDYSEYEVGSTNASFEVDPTGAARYSIPIYTPPGVGDLQPTLEIAFNAQAGNGLLGVGFAVSGLSTISRCPRTRAQDGIARVAIAPTYTDDDAFCLDGQRLVLVEGSGANGQPGAEYRTEVDSFSRITIVAGDGGSDVWFRVETKSAQTFEYGKTANSRIKLRGHVGGASQDNIKTMTWAVENIFDVAGNSVHFDYLTNADNTTGYRPEKITYGESGFEVTVKFVYDEIRRFDASEGYMHGYKLSSHDRMNSIQVNVGTNLVREYNFTYDETSTTRKSRMHAIQECVANGDCLPPVKFDWTQGPTGFVSKGVIKHEESSHERDPEMFKIFDFTGDGQTDFIIGPVSNSNWHLIAGKDLEDEGDNRGLSPNRYIEYNWLGGSWSHNLDRIRTMDMTGDGHLDIVAGPNGNGDIWAKERNADGSGLLNLGKVADDLYGSWKDAQDRIRPMDFNGDGKQDLMFGPTSSGQWNVLRSNGSSFSAITNYISDGFADPAWIQKDIGPDHISFVDVDNDGLQDILIGPGTDGYWDLLKNTGAGFVKDNNFIDRQGQVQSTTTQVCTSWRTNKGGDRICNGYEPVTTTAFTNFFDTGIATSSQCAPATKGDDCPSYNTVWSYDADMARGIRLFDVNADGLADLVSGPRADNKWYVALNTGSGIHGQGFLPVEQWGSGYHNFSDNQDRVFPMDIDADGFTDVLIGPNKPGLWYWMRSTGTGFENMGSMPSEFGEWHNDEHRIHVADINGDGMSEIVLSPDATTWRGFGPNAGVPDQLIGITNGSSPKTTIEYQSTSQDSDAIYSQNEDDSRMFPMHIVKRVRKGDGLGGEYTTSYKYSEFKLDLEGRGPKGFKTVEATDSITNSITTTTYRQDFPYAGMPQRVERRVDGKLVVRVTNDYRDLHQDLASDNGLYHPYLAKSTEESFGYNKSEETPFKIVISETGHDGASLKMDAYGNVTWVRVTTIGGGETYTKTTTSRYDQDVPARWILGRLTEAEVEHTGPDGAPITRKSLFSYYNQGEAGGYPGQLKSETIGANHLGTVNSKVTTYTYDGNGLRNKVTESGVSSIAAALEDRTAESTIDFVNLGDAARVFSEFYLTHPTMRTQLSNALGETETTWTSLAHGEVIRHIGPNGKETVSKYDGLGRLISTTSHLGVTQETAYRWTNQNPLNTVYSITKQTRALATDPVGLEDDNTVYYDALNREIRTETRTLDGRHVIKETFYDSRGLIAKANRPYLAFTTPVWHCFTYDEIGRIKTEDFPGANGGPNCGGGNRAVSMTTYGVDGLTVSRLDALGRVKREIRNVMDKVKQIDETPEALGTAEHSWLNYSYDPMQQLIMVKDALGKETHLTYDVSGRKKSMQDPAMGAWSYEYNSFGELEQQTDAKGQVIRMEYDRLGRMVRRDDNYLGSPGWDWIWSYGTLGDSNEIGKLKSVTGPDGFNQSHDYNDKLQLSSTTLTQTIDPGGLMNRVETLTSNFVYDGYGRIVETVYPENFRVQNEYNRYGHMIAVKSPAQPLEAAAGQKLANKRDEFQAMADTAKTEANDFMSQAIRLQAEASRFETHAASLLELDANAASSDDAAELNAAAARLRDISYVLIKKSEASMIKAFAAAAEANSNSGIASPIHNRHRFLALQESGLAINYLDKARSILPSVSQVTSNAEVEGLLTQVEVNLGQAADSLSGYQHQQALADRYYRLAQGIDTDIGNTTQTVWWRAAEADSEGRITRSVYGNGTTTNRVYDPNNGHLLSIETSDGVNTIQNLRYEYDHMNNVKRRVDDVLNYEENYLYDKLDRLQTATISAGGVNAQRSWAYDKTGNIDAIDGQAYNYEANALDPNLAKKLVSTPNQPGLFVYDDNGNVETSGGRNYTWTTFNKPSSLSDASASVRFTYGADRARINKVNLANGSVTKTTAYFGAYQKITAANGDIEHKYHVSAGGAMIAVHSVKTDSGGVPTETAASNYLHKDALGSVSVITSAVGAIVEQLAYTPFGSRRDVTALASFTNYHSLLLPALTKRGITVITWTI